MCADVLGNAHFMSFFKVSASVDDIVKALQAYKQAVRTCGAEGGVLVGPRVPRLLFTLCIKNKTVYAVCLLTAETGA